MVGHLQSCLAGRVEWRGAPVGCYAESAKDEPFRSRRDNGVGDETKNQS